MERVWLSYRITDQNCFTGSWGAGATGNPCRRRGTPLGIDESCHVLRAIADGLRIHRGRHTSGIEEEGRIGVEDSHAVLLELVTAIEARAPRAVGVVVALRDPQAAIHGARGGIADHCGLAQDFLHARIGRKRLALPDADRGVQAKRDRIDRIGRLFLHDLVEILPERIVRRCQRAECLAGDMHELQRRRIGGVLQAIDLGVLLYEIHARFRIAVNGRSAREPRR